MRFIKRLLANMVDIITFFALLVAAFLYALPFIAEYIENTTVSAVIVLVLVVIVTAGIQAPFLLVHQTLGKAFFGLRVVSANRERPITPGIVVQRELFAKVATGYLLCLPVFVGKKGGHDIVTETEVV
jgi:uncharacterized RDD family membrane protein YckC